MKLNGVSFPKPTDKIEIISSPQFLAGGSFHFVFRIETRRFAPMVYKVPKDKFNGYLGPYNVANKIIDSDVVNSKLYRPASVNLDRGIRIWNAVNDNVFVMKFGQGLLAPYFNNDWKRPSDDKMADIVLKIYQRTKRVFMDVFCDNVRVSPDDDTFVVIDTDCLLKFTKKNTAATSSDHSDGPGYESDGSSKFWPEGWVLYFADYMNLYPKTLKQILDLLRKENELSMLSPVNQLRFHVNNVADYRVCLNLFAILAKEPVNASYLLTKTYIDTCCHSNAISYLQISTISLFLNGSLVTFASIESLIGEVLKRIKSENMDDGRWKRTLSILYRVKDLSLTLAQKKKLFALIAGYAKYFPGNLLDYLSSLGQSLPESALECLVRESHRLSKDCVRNILSCSDRLSLNILIDLLKTSLFDNYIRDWVQGLYSMITQGLFLYRFADYLCHSVMNQDSMSLHTVDLKLMIENNSSPWVGQNRVDISKLLALNYVSLISTQLHNHAPGQFLLTFGVETGNLNIKMVQLDNSLKLQTENHLLLEYSDCYDGKLNMNKFHDLCLALLCTQSTAQDKGWWWNAATGYSRWEAAQKVVGTSRESFDNVLLKTKPASFFGQHLVTEFNKQDNRSHVLRRFNRRYTSKPYLSMDALCRYLFRTRYSATARGWWWQSKTGYASWQAIEGAIGIKRENYLRQTSWRELESAIIDNYCEKYNSVKFPVFIANN